MKDLTKQIIKIKKSYFTFNDLRKISAMSDPSLLVTVNRMVKSGELTKISKGYYCLDISKVDLPKVALEIYKPSYLSFEWALGYYGILSQQTYALTLATTKRAKHTSIGNTQTDYHHLREDLFFGYAQKDGHLIAEPEKAFLDLAYLSLNGYAKFDVEEINLELLDKVKIKKYLKIFNDNRLTKLIESVIKSKQ